MLIAWRDAAARGEDLDERRRLAILAFLAAGGSGEGAADVVKAILAAGARELGDWLFGPEWRRLDRERRYQGQGADFPIAESDDGDAPC